VQQKPKSLDGFMSSELTTYVAKTALERAGELLRRKVIEKWADRRARSFIEEFVDNLSSDGPIVGEAVDRKLNEIVDDEEKSAALFDAFRRVAVSASRDIGPRVIALHIAEVVNGLIDDPPVSDAVMAAATSLLDFEFADFVSFVASKGMEEASFADSLGNSLIIMADTAEFDSNWKRRRSETGPISLRSEFGSWAQKLEVTGLLYQDVSEEEFDYEPDSEQHIDEPGSTRRVYRNVVLGPGTSHLFRLTKRARRARDSS
jgi:hypothetical protein